jgi:hypothetical protein
MDKANKLKTPCEQRFQNRIIVKSSSSYSITVKTASSIITKTCNNNNILESSEPLDEKLNIWLFNDPPISYSADKYKTMYKN